MNNTYITEKNEIKCEFYEQKSQMSNQIRERFTGIIAN